MTLTTEIILAVGILCANISAFIFGMFWERYRWNRLIERGRLPHPDQNWTPNLGDSINSLRAIINNPRIWK